MGREAQLLNLEEPELLDDIGTGRNELVLKCLSGAYKDRFFYVSLSDGGEVIGSESSDTVEVTVVISNARLSKLQCRVRYFRDLAQYFIQDLHSAEGTWIQAPVNQLSATPLAPNMSIAIGPYVFRIELGSSVDVMEEIVAKHSLLPWLTSLELRPSLEEFVSSDYSRLPLSEEGRARFAAAVEDAVKHRGGFVGLKLTDGQRRFQAGIRDLLIGSSPGCDVVLAGLKPHHAVVSYREDSHLIVRLAENAPVFIRLLSEDEIPLVPGSTVKMGTLDFEVCRFNVGRCAEIGVRTCMEDFDCVIQDLGLYEGLPVSYFAIYDGHGGVQCSQFLQENLHGLLRSNLLVPNNLHFDLNKALQNAFHKSFQECDELFCKSDPAAAKVSGSTAVVCLIIGDKVVAANVGDSRAVLSRRGVAIDLTVDQRAVLLTQDRPEELKRIEANGGVVFFKRVLGRIAVSRAFGDFEFKQTPPSDLTSKVTGPLLSVEPEVREEYLHPLDDEFILIACDGLFDVFSSQEAVDVVRRKLLQMPMTEQDPQRVVRELVNEAIYTRQSKDNVTALLITLTCGIR